MRRSAGTPPRSGHGYDGKLCRQGVAPSPGPQGAAWRPAQAEYKTTYSGCLKTAAVPGHGPGRVVFKAIVAQERIAERLAAKATGKGSADRLAVLDSLVVFLGQAEAPGEQFSGGTEGVA